MKYVLLVQKIEEKIRYYMAPSADFQHGYYTIVRKQTGLEYLFTPWTLKQRRARVAESILAMPIITSIRKLYKADGEEELLLRILEDGCSYREQSRKIAKYFLFKKKKRDLSNLFTGFFNFLIGRLKMSNSNLYQLRRAEAEAWKIVKDLERRKERAEEFCRRAKGEAESMVREGELLKITQELSVAKEKAVASRSAWQNLK